jgi:branched-chain amino acid transport system substrate-binding protein
MPLGDFSRFHRLEKPATSWKPREFNCLFFHVDGCHHAPYILTFASRTADNVREALQQDPAVTKIVRRMYLMDRRLSPFGQLWSSGLFVFASHVWTGNMSAPRKARLEIPLGLLCSTTGTYGSVGQSMLNGALLAIEQVATDARYDFAFTPVAADPGGELARYFSLSQQLLTDGVSHVIGCYTSSSRKEVVPLFERADALLWYPSHYEGFECSENVIYVGASPNQHIVPLAGYMLSTRGKQVYMVGSNYVWAWESNRVMRDIVETNGGSVLAERYLPLGVRDVQWIVDEIQALKPDFIFSSLIGASTLALLTQYAASAGKGAPVEADYAPLTSCNLSEIDLQMVEPEARVGHICSAVYFQSVDSPANHGFVGAYRARFGGQSVTCADAEASYVAVHLLAEAILECGSADVERVRQCIAKCSLDAPQGAVRVDGENQHSFLTPRLGRSTANGHFDVVLATPEPVKPDPYLVWFDARRDVRGWSATEGGWSSPQRMPLRAVR